MRLSTVHLSTARSWRGGENQVLLLARGLVERGHEALVLAPRGAPLLERARECGLPVRALAVRGAAGPLGLLRLARLLRRMRPDVLHLHDSHAVLAGYLAARGAALRKLKVIAHRRTAFPLRGGWKYQGRVDKVIAISAAVRGQLLAGGVPPERIAVVHSGLEFSEPLLRDSPSASALRAELNLTPQAVLAAHAAALTAEKRHADLLEALALAGGRRGAPELHLAIAGGGELEGALREQARRLGIEPRAHFLGFRRDLRPLWAAGDVAVFASEAEGLCTALLEAQGAGLPAVVTRAGGMTEAVEDGVTGLTVEVGDAAGLAAALLRLAADSEERARMGRAAAERARRLFSAGAMVEGALAVYAAP